MNRCDGNRGDSFKWKRLGPSLPIPQKSRHLVKEMKLEVDEKLAEAAVVGGSFLGGGGGGDLKQGLRDAKHSIRIGDVYIIDVDSVPNNSSIVTASAVGAPAAKEKYLVPEQMIRSTELLLELENLNVGGIISCENGGNSTVNGWIQAAALKIPVVDAPADGRAHPTGVMGAMGLHKAEDYVSVQTAVGGNKKKKRWLELFVKGDLERTSRIVREAAVQAGGLVAVTRNPVSKNYVKENSAVGGITQAIEVGKIIKKHKDSLGEMINRIIAYLGGKLIDYGTVKNTTLETKGGFDVGNILVDGKKESRYEIVFWNEFMTLEADGKYLGSFPDLIVLLNTENSLPLTSAEIKRGQRVAILVVPQAHILLGAGVKDPEVLKQAERVIGKRLIKKVKKC